MSVKTHQKLVDMFSRTCHQLPERSLHFKGRQFPFCARCTGVYIGNILSVLGAFLYIPRREWLLCGCSVILTDWLIQFVEIRESTNLRRIITGIIGGYSLSSLFISVLIFAVNTLFY